MYFQSILSSEIALLDDSDEEKESKRDLLLVCVLAGEYVFAIKSFNWKRFARWFWWGERIIL